MQVVVNSRHDEIESFRDVLWSGRRPSLNVDRRKRRAGISVVLLAASVALGACGGRDAATADPSTLADTLAALISSAYRFDTPGAPDRMKALYAEGEQVVSASGGTLTVGADSVRSGIDSFWARAGTNMREARWEWREFHATRLGPDAAVLTGTWAIPHIAPDGNPHRIEGAWTAVFERIDGDWKIVHEHLSEPAPQ